MQITIKALSVQKVGINIIYTNSEKKITLKDVCTKKVSISFANIGPQGIPGEGSILSAPAGEIINGDSLLMLKDGKVYKNVPDEENAYLCCGFAKNSAVVDQIVNVTIAGEHTSAGFGLLVGGLYYAGTSGGITTTPPNVGISQVVGIAKNEDTIFVTIDEPFIIT